MLSFGISALQNKNEMRAGKSATHVLIVGTLQ